LGKQTAFFQPILKFDAIKSLVPSLNQVVVVIEIFEFHCGVNISANFSIQDFTKTSFESSLHQLSGSVLGLIRGLLQGPRTQVEVFVPLTHL
jgi:hypothetical protein